MIGRTEERALIEELLVGARSGRSGTLVVHGEPGVGKSVLLSHAVDSGDGMRVLRATGVESEVDLAFAGLYQLVRPVLGLTDRLLAPQREALMGALGLAGHASEDRFLVGVAALSLLSEAADEGPVLCVVEDAHWLDGPSAEILAFAMRRLGAEGVVVLVATREEPWAGLPARHVAGFGRSDADALLREYAGEVAPRVRDRLVAETGGNPLALVELPSALSAGQLAGREPLPAQLPLTGRVQEAFLGRVRRLGWASQTLLLVAAADDTGDPAVVLRAAGQLGAGTQALEETERTGLAAIDSAGRIRFRHPLVRAAVYKEATFTARLSAHRALVQALDGDDHLERRAWHLAAAATGPDETAARELERSAERAEQRGGYAVAAAAFERAAELSTGRADRARLVVAAAQAAHRAGQADRVAVLADRAGQLVDDPVTAAEVAHLKGQIELALGSSTAAHTLLVTAARPMAGRDPRLAAMALLEAARAAWNANDASRLIETIRMLATLRLPPGDPLVPLVSATMGLSDLVTGRIPGAVDQIRRGISDWLALAAGRPDPDPDPGHGEGWVPMGAGIHRAIGDDTAGLTLGAMLVTQCRTRGLAGELPWALADLALTEATAGRLSRAVADATEGLQLARDLGYPMAVCRCESVLAWLAAARGEERRCRELAAAACAKAETYQLASIAVVATWGLGLLELSLGHPERALDRFLDPQGPRANPLGGIVTTPDLAEAAARTGRTGEAEGPVAVFEEWAAATGQPWACAAAHRCRALLDSGAAEAHFTQALWLHEQAGPADRPFDRARTQLLYGQWLRRARRRVAARSQLTAAYETFERLGVVPWAERVATELRASGQTLRRRESAAARLTPQEMQVVRLVAEGGSNHDVAAALFISPRTVAYHLYKAFPKLGIVSRADLARLDLEALIATP